MSGFIRVDGRFVALDALVERDGEWINATRVTPDQEDDDEVEAVVPELDLDDQDAEGDDE